MHLSESDIPKMYDPGLRVFRLNEFRVLWARKDFERKNWQNRLKSDVSF